MLTVYRSEASASLRRVPLWLVLSDGTSPATVESGGQPQICWHPRGTATAATAATLSLVSANAGLYHVELSASEVSALGVFSVHFRSATAIANTAFGKIVNYDSGDSVRFGQFSLPNAAAEAAGGLITFGIGTGQLHTSTGSIGLKQQVHSGATVGAGNIAPGIYSAVSVSIRDGGIQPVSVGAGTYSSVTIQGLSNYANISNVTLAAGTHSNVTIQGLSNYANISSVTLNIGTHSGATVQGVSNYANISNVTLHAGTHSAATVQGVSNYANISNVTLAAGTHSGATIDGVLLVGTAGMRSIASSWMSTNLGSDRFAQEAIFALRNRVQISGSTGTVFHPDDVTSSWTFSVTTGTSPLAGIDPGGV